MKPLQDLTSLILTENPVVTLPHYLQFTIFHLRSLESLEGQAVTTQDRQDAFERFSLGKMAFFFKIKFGWERNNSEVIQEDILCYELHSAIKVCMEIDTVNQFNKYSFSTSCEPSTVYGTEDTIVRWMVLVFVQLVF